MSFIHDEIIQILFELCMEHKTDTGKKRYSKIYSEHIGMDRMPIILTARSKVKPEAKYYYPDIWAKVKRVPDVHIFEVWHTEPRANAVEDILFSSFVEDLTYLHIVCTGKKLSADDAQELVNLIIYNVRDDNGELRLKPNYVYITEVPQEMHDNVSQIKNHLAEELAFNL